MNMNSKYPFAFGFLESAMHRALRELEAAQVRLSIDDPSEAARPVNEARAILRGALRDLQFNHGVELHWPDDVKGEHDDV